MSCRSRRSALPPVVRLGLCLLVSVAALAGPSRLTAQADPPAAAVARVVALLEASGYSASFSLVGGDVSGLARYQHSAAYALTVDPGDGVTIEYILLDPLLYTRVTPAGEPPPAWEQALWHPDIPVPGLTAYHPRLPLELLRAGEDWQDAGAGAEGVRRLEGTVRYITAIYAAYEDVPNAVQQSSRIGVMRFPVTLVLDTASGLPRSLALSIPADAGDLGVPTTLTYRDFSTGPRLEPPPDAVERDSPLTVREAPAGVARPLPLDLEGEGTQIRTPIFRSDAGAVSLRLSPGQTDVQLSLWRIQRGRLLLAALATADLGAGEGDLEFAFPAAPGDYIVEVRLPAAAPWRLTIEDIAADTLPVLPRAGPAGAPADRAGTCVEPGCEKRRDSR